MNDHLKLKPLTGKSSITSEWLCRMLSLSLQKSICICSFSCKKLSETNGFLSDIFMITIDLETYEKLFLVVKLLPSDLLSKDFIMKTNISVKECAFNNLILDHKFITILTVANIILPIPKVYYAGCHSESFAIVMEDMNYRGYNPCVTCEGLDTSTTVIAFKTIAVIHACGYKYLEEHGPNSLKKLKSSIEGEIILEQLSYDIIKEAIEICSNLLECNSPLQVKLRSVIKKGTYKNLFTDCEGPLPSTIIHGDFWSGQTLYNSGELSFCILDWQFVDVSNPAYDLITFLLMSCSCTVYKQDLPEVLAAYLIEVNSNLSKLGSGMRIQMHDLLQSVHRVWSRGLVVLLASVKTFMSHNKISKERLIEAIYFADSLGLFS